MMRSIILSLRRAQLSRKAATAEYVFYPYRTPVDRATDVDFQICHLAEDSISKVLDENDNASHLLDLHRRPIEMTNAMPASPSRHITIK